MTKFTNSKGLSRRTLLKGAASTAVAAGATTLGAPMLWAQNIKDVTIRQFGTGVSNLNDVATKVKEDLGFTLEMTALDTDSVTQRAATQPNSFDIADIEYFIAKKVWGAGNLQAMDTSKIVNYDKIAGTFRSGLLTPDSTIAQGTAPHTVGFTSGKNGTDFVQEESGWMTLIPTIYNADTLGIRPDLIGRPISNWSELLNPEFKGKQGNVGSPDSNYTYIDPETVEEITFPLYVIIDSWKEELRYRHNSADPGVVNAMMNPKNDFDLWSKGSNGNGPPDETAQADIADDIKNW